MQQHAVERQQQYNNNFGLKFRIGKIGHAFFKVINTYNRSSGDPQEYQRIGNRLLKTGHMLIVVPRRHATFQQVLDHGGIAGKHQADSYAASQQVNVHNA
ncbi:hypothetical protein D3C86_1520730 [compost metagenome]